jgi:hypothetical protein
MKQRLCLLKPKETVQTSTHDARLRDCHHSSTHTVTTSLQQISLELHEVLLSPSKYVFMIRQTNAEYALSPAASPDLAIVKEMPEPVVLNHASMNAKILRFCPNDASPECQLPPYAQSVLSGDL